MPRVGSQGGVFSMKYHCRPFRGKDLRRARPEVRRARSAMAGESGPLSAAHDHLWRQVDHTVDHSERVHFVVISGHADPCWMGPRPPGFCSTRLG